MQVWGEINGLVGVYLLCLWFLIKWSQKHKASVYKADGLTSQDHRSTLNGWQAIAPCHRSLKTLFCTTESGPHWAREPRSAGSSSCAAEHTRARTLSYSILQCTGEGRVSHGLGVQWREDTGGHGHAVFIQGQKGLKDGWSAEFASSYSFSLWLRAEPAASPGILETAVQIMKESLGLLALANPIYFSFQTALMNSILFLRLHRPWLSCHASRSKRITENDLFIFVIATPLAISSSSLLHGLGGTSRGHSSSVRGASGTSW